MKKRIYSLLFAVVILASFCAVAASATEVSEYLYAKIDGGATVSTKSAKKTVGGAMFFAAQPATSSGWNASGNEWVYFRGRDSSGYNWATNSAHLNYTGYEKMNYMSYLSGYGVMNDYYKMAIQYDSSNPYTYVELIVRWNP